MFRKSDFKKIRKATYNWCLNVTFPQSLQRRRDVWFHDKAVTLMSNVHYLHVLHGQNVHPALRSPLNQLRAERVHDDDRFEHVGQAFLPVLQQNFCLLLIVTQHCGDVR